MAQMPKFLEDYTTVDELISKMNKEYPECRLVSELIGYGDDWAIFKSSFFENKDDVEPKATAYAKQTSKDHNSWFEMCNTKANGRCLRIVFSESTLAEEMIGIAPSKSQSTKLIDSSGGQVKDLGSITYKSGSKKVRAFLAKFVSGEIVENGIVDWPDWENDIKRFVPEEVARKLLREEMQVFLDRANAFLRNL